MAPPSMVDLELIKEEPATTLFSADEYTSTITTEAAHSSKTLMKLHQITWFHIRGDYNRVREFLFILIVVHNLSYVELKKKYIRFSEKRSSYLNIYS
jgi:hypothetical protein